MTRLLGIFFVTGSIYAGALDHWITNTVPVSNLTGAAFGKGVFVATASPGPSTGWIGFSLDGVHWSNGRCGGGDCTPLPLFTVAFLNDRFVAAGSYGFTYVSSNGIDWRVNFVPPSDSNLRSICYGNGKFVVAGEMESCPCGFIAASSDGASWVPLQADDLLFVQGIAYGNDRFVAVALSEYGASSYRSNTYTALDPLSAWTRIGTLTTNDFFSVAFGHDRFVTVGQEHHSGTASIFWSSNGLSWIKSTSPVPSPLRGINFAAGMFMAVSTSGALLTSSDGIGWSNRLTRVSIRTPAILARDAIWIGSNIGFLRSDPLVRVDITRSAPPELVVSGLESRSYRIESSTTAIPWSWNPVETFFLFGSPALWRDARPQSGSARFYRAVLLDP
jgi:hypothetical protein